MIVAHCTAWQMIMELAEGGDLYAEVIDTKGKGLPLDDRGSDDEGNKLPGARSYARQILLGLAYCHKRSIAHRDLKLENLLLSADRQTCKIADFGLAKISTKRDETMLGTIKCVPAWRKACATVPLDLVPTPLVQPNSQAMAAKERYEIV